MFSANENLVLRQHKRRIVNAVESTMPEEALDMGTSVMVMQVSCKDPGCVPLETAIIIVFPKCGNGGGGGGGEQNQIIPGLPESNGGSYKTKILKPMADVTEDDVLDNLPPAFEGGRRTMERVCLYSRDVMIAQITQLFGDGSDDSDSEKSNDNGNGNGNDKSNNRQREDRIAMARFLQACLQDYIDGGCKPPEFGKPFASANAISNGGLTAGADDADADADAATDGEKTFSSSSNSSSSADPPNHTNSNSTGTTRSTIPAKGNVVIRRSVDTTQSTTTSTTTTAAAATVAPTGRTTKTGGTTTSVRIRQPPQHERAIVQTLLRFAQSDGDGSSGHNAAVSAISRLFEREHAPGIRKPGCPCCDPSDPEVLADSFAML